MSNSKVDYCHCSNSPDDSAEAKYQTQEMSQTVYLLFSAEFRGAIVVAMDQLQLC